MGNQVLLGHSTHRNGDFPFLFVGMPFTQRAIPQGDPLWEYLLGEQTYPSTYAKEK